MILLDDDPDVRVSLGDVLGSAGYQVKAYASGKELLADPQVRAAYLEGGHH